MPPPSGPPALALLSGGLDSTVAAALYRAQKGPLSAALFVDYGQRAALPEARAASAVAAALGCELRIATLPLLGEITTTALVNRAARLPQPEPARLDADAALSADAVWVPNRNGLLVNLAAAVAEAAGLRVVVVGFNAEEAATFPDNGPRFVEHLNACLAESTRGRVRVECPTLAMSKAELLAAGRAVGAPIELSWSCYEGGERPCGRCESCRRRQRAEEGAAARR
ncbi:MAG TPA: 7-cyano-7-deazaguanine synthase QueC [Planctomycetota bacterium]|nr:7-cyano-7-deazaguanine synthase QueC [Planctomycetota bacterium]